MEVYTHHRDLEQVRALLGVAQQRVRTVADEIDGRLVTGKEEQHTRSQELVFAQPVASFLGGDQGRQFALYGVRRQPRVHLP